MDQSCDLSSFEKESYLEESDFETSEVPLNELSKEPVGQRSQPKKGESICLVEKSTAFQQTDQAPLMIRLSFDGDCRDSMFVPLSPLASKTDVDSLWAASIEDPIKF